MKRMILTLAIALLAGLPTAKADIGVSATVRSGDSFLSIRNGNVRGRLQVGDSPTLRERRSRRERRRLRRDRRTVIVVPRRSLVTERTVPPPPPPEVKTGIPGLSKSPPEPAAPPDPAGDARILRARGVAAPIGGLAVGRRIPRGIPHVTLDHRRYELPPPPDGQIYARVRGSVVLIDPVSRIVRALDVQ